MKVLAIIPARSGSKSVKDKNIREVGGRPMLAWSIEHAKKSRLVNRVILSTDSERYAQIGREYGAEVPFIRPAEYATDTALDIDVFRHALTWLKENEGYSPDIVVQLRPTYPKRDPEDIDRMIELLAADPSADSVRSVALAGEVPYKMWRFADDTFASHGDDACASHGDTADSDGDRSAALLTPLMTDIPECYNMPRQELPTVYYQNACIDVARADTILKLNSMTGRRILGYVMKENLDIDTEVELLRAENELLKNELEKLKSRD